MTMHMGVEAARNEAARRLTRNVDATGLSPDDAYHSGVIMGQAVNIGQSILQYVPAGEAKEKAMVALQEAVDWALEGIAK